MRCKITLTVGIALSLPVLLAGSLEAGGILQRHHGNKDCPADQSTVVRLPAQEIRIETTKPRVIVNQMSATRMRGYFPAGQAVVPGPFMATFYTPMGFNPASFGLMSTNSSSNALDAAHALERQHMEFAKQKAALAAEMAHVEKVHQRILGNISAGATPAPPAVSDVAQLKTAIENMSKRIGDIERLILAHDDWIKSKK